MWSGFGRASQVRRMHRATEYGWRRDPSYLLIPHFRNPVPGPLHGLQFKVTDATGKKDHSLDSSFLEPIQPYLALVLHEVHRHRLPLAVIPQVAAQHSAILWSKPFHPLQVVFQVLEI